MEVSIGKSRRLGILSPLLLAMYLCTRCHQALDQKVEVNGVTWCCSTCRGQAVGFGVLRKDIGEKRLAKIWAAANGVSDHVGCTCPICAKPMTTATVEFEGQELELDLCYPCGFVWFDEGELEKIPPALPKPVTLDEINRKKMTKEVQEKLALAEVHGKASRDNYGASEPDEEWKTVPALFGLPVEMDSTLIERTPWATYLLGLAITVISLAAFTNLQPIVDSYGLIADQAWRYHGLTFLTSFFLHGGVFHLVSNVYFLLIFGRAVEKDLGPWRWFLLVLVATLTGDLLHVLGDPRGDLPCIGASGGISGLMAYYALKFPRVRLGMLLSFGLLYRWWIQFPAWVLFLLWILLQIYGAWVEIFGVSDVSALAHFGGVAVGVVFWWVLRKRQPNIAAGNPTNPLQIMIK